MLSAARLQAATEIFQLRKIILYLLRITNIFMRNQPHPMMNEWRKAECECAPVLARITIVSQSQTFRLRAGFARILYSYWGRTSIKVCTNSSNDTGSSSEIASQCEQPLNYFRLT